MNNTRRIILTAGAIALIPAASRSDILVGYNFGATVPTATLSPTSLHANVNALAISADAGLTLDLSSPATQPASAPYLRTLFTVASTTEAAAFANNADFKFTLNANPGYELDLTSLTFNAMRGGSSTPRGFAVRSSVDGFTSVLLTADIPTTRPNFTAYNLDLSGAVFQNLSTITFKIYSYSPAAGASVEYDDFIVNGLSSALPFSGFTWVGSVDGNWNTTTANWSGTGTIYSEGGDVLFGNSATTAISVVAGGLTPNSVTIDSATSDYTFSGGSLAITSSLLKTGTSTATIFNTVSVPAIQAGAGTLEVGAGGTLTSPNLNVSATGNLVVTAGGALGATTALTVVGGVTFSNTAQSITNLAGAGTVALDGAALNVTGSATFAGKFTGSGSLVKNTAGTLLLSGSTSDFSGGINISSGAVNLTAAAAGGTGTIKIESGGILLLGANTATPMELSGGTIGVSAASTSPAILKVSVPSIVNTFNTVTAATPNNFILTGMLQGSGDISVSAIANTAPDAQPGFRLNGPASIGPDAYTGTITVAQSTKFELLTTTASGSPMGTGKLRLTAGTTALDASGTYSNTLLRNNFGGSTVLGNDIEIVGTGAAYMNLVGSAPAGSTTRMGSLAIGNGQALGAIATGGTLQTLAFDNVTLGGGTSTFIPRPVGNTSFTATRNIELGDISESTPGAGIVINGVGAVTIAGTATHTGPTDIQAGTLAIGPVGSLNGSSAIRLSGAGTKLNVTAMPSGLEIGTGQALAGIGDWDGTIHLTGGTLSPGNSIGTLSGDHLTIEGGSALSFELSTFDDTSDRVNLSGFLTKGSPGAFVFDFTGGAESQTYTLFSFLGTDFLASDFSYTGLGPGLTGAFQMNASELQFAVVPEPSSVLALFGGLGLLALRRRHTSGH